MNQGASARGNVHHQGVIYAGVVTEGRVGLLVEKTLGIFLVTVLIFKEPDIEDFLGILGEIGFFEFFSNVLKRRQKSGDW